VSTRPNLHFIPIQPTADNIIDETQKHTHANAVLKIDAEKRMTVEVADDPVVKQLLQQPGIGPITAITMRAIIGHFMENIHVPQFGYNWMERQSTLYYKTSHELANISKWCAFIDIDEFILPRKVDSIPEVLREYEEYEGVRLKWCIFGTSGYKLNPPTRINHLLHRGYDDLDLNQLEKPIIRSGYATSPEIHRFATIKNHQIVLPPEVMRINHYNATSWQHHRDVKGIRRPKEKHPGHDYNMAHFQRHDRNEVHDDEISRRFGHSVKHIDEVRK